MKIKELFLNETEEKMTSLEVIDMINYWAEKEWIPKSHSYGMNTHGFLVGSLGNVEIKLPKFELVNEMLNDDGTFPFKLTRSNILKVRANNLTSFKNFPEIAENWSQTKISVVLDMLAPSFPKLASLEGFPKYCRGHVRLSQAKNLSFANVHKHILAANIISVDPYYVGPMLGFLKIQNLQEIKYLFADKGNFHEAAKIINKYLPLGNIFECQEELIDNDLKDYAEL